MAYAATGFDEFFCNVFLRLVAFLMKIGASREEAEDAAQEALAKAYQSWDHIEHPEGWVRIVAERVFWASIKRANAAPGKAIVGGWTANQVLDPDLSVLRDEQRMILQELLKLPYEQRRVMAWYYDDFTIAEIAALTGRPEATIRSNLRHARRRLAARLPKSDQGAATPAPTQTGGD